MKPFTFQEGGIEGCNNQTEECHFDIWFLLSPIYLLCQKSDYLVTLYDRFWCVIVVSRGKIDFGLVMSCLLHIYNFTECGSMRVWILSSLRLESYQKKYSCHQQFCAHSMNWFIHNEMFSQYENWKCFLQFERSQLVISRDEKLLLQVLLFKVLSPKQRYGNILYNNNSNVAYFFFCSDFILNEAYFFRRFVRIWPTSTSNT